MQRKLFKRLMAASLATVMVVGMAGCGNNAGESGSGDSQGSDKPSESTQTPSESTPDTTPSEPEGEVSPYTVKIDPATGEAYDLGGRAFTLYTWFGINSPDSDYGDAQAAYREWAEDTYNFTFTVDDSGDWGGNFNKLGELAVGGLESVNNEYRAYLVPGGQGAVMANIKAGLTWDITELGVIDFTETRYAVNGNADMYQLDGHVYGFCAGYPEPRGGVWFNKELLEQTTGMKADDLYDLQASNEWTWAKFEEICQKIYDGGDTDNDGIQDIYALAGNTGSLLNYACISNGKEMFGYKNGKFIYQAEDPEVSEAFEWFLKIMRADYWYPQPEGTEWDYFYPAFDDEGKIVFLPEDAYHITGRLSVQTGTEANASNAGTYGFLMFPIGPSANGKFVNGYTDNVVVIPKCYNEEEAKSIAVAYDLWTAPIPGYEEYNDRLDGYANHVFDDRMLNETLVRMMSEGALVRAPGVPSVNVGEDIAKANPDAEGNDQWWPASMTAAQMVESCATKWKSAVDDANK